MKYLSTRGSGPIEALEAVRRGLAPDGGLYVPDSFPTLDIAALQGLSYPAIAAAVMAPFLPQVGHEALVGITTEAYRSFDSPEVVPLVTHGGTSWLELFGGPTSAFKDMALTVLPHLLAAARTGATGRSLVLTATSGDTGKAALSGFAEVSGTEVLVLYPTDGVSHVQKLQMTTQQGDNVHVIGIRGDFDDAQRAVKALLQDAEFRDVVAARGDELTSANSINLGRLLPQVAYYVHGWLQLRDRGVIGDGEEIDVVVPTGNFGNILAASYARELGVPLGRLVCASNDNRVLADFFATGTYDANRSLVRTSSPSMDILVSSNLERFLWHLGGTERVVEAMESLRTWGSFTWDGLPDWLVGATADEAAMAATLRSTWEEHHYLLDPHTAVATAVADRLRSGRHVLVAATASPFKFAPAVLGALGEPVPTDGFAAFDALEGLSGLRGPAALSDLRTAPVRHELVVDAGDVTRAVKAELA